MSDVRVILGWQMEEGLSFKEEVGGRREMIPWLHGRAEFSETLLAFRGIGAIHCNFRAIQDRLWPLMRYEDVGMF
jgi:hypothetical protein